MQRNEITRLNTALEYAKAAEENRRQMTSNIAHELKTPLAVIHSYAEGLKEHIAEDKRDKYVDVILAEAERTDGMVLEMLDLSRLEAGKVKLSRDEFSLADLTKAIFEKLQMAAEAKELQISYEFPEQSTIVADENRIAQVVENFATNAVKYTPAGGSVTVRIQNNRGKTTFSIENDSKPLSAEALAKVWDTFYRVDESRSGGGTGLGLAIAKNIVELHGGKCSVRNTKTGVEFQFTI
jgi:signal transduction histidine kinase